MVISSSHNGTVKRVYIHKKYMEESTTKSTPRIYFNGVGATYHNTRKIKLMENGEILYKVRVYW